MPLRELFQREGIPGCGAWWYSWIARRSPILRDFYREVAEEVSSKISSGRILDVGTGPGYLPLEIALKSEGLDIVGIDISPAMVDIARRNAAKRGYSERVQFHTARASDLPFPDGYFDLAVSSFSFHHWLKPVDCMREISRVLKEGGEAWIYDFRRDTTEEEESQVRKRYGWFLSFLFLNIVRSHSSVTLREVEKVLAAPEIGFSEKGVPGTGVVLKICLRK